MDQGCSFSPALFAILIADALDAVRAELRTVDSSVGVLSYLDDIYIVVAAEAAGRALEAVDRNFAPLGLTLNPGKCKWWCGQEDSVPVGLPASVERAARLPVLGAALPFVVASDIGELDLLDHAGPLREACTALETYWQNLCKLRCEGLPLDVALNFHTTFVTGAITHFLRATYAPEAWCQNWDDRALRFWELEIQRDFGPDQRLQFFLPMKLAGSGVQAAEHRRACMTSPKQSA